MQFLAAALPELSRPPLAPAVDDQAHHHDQQVPDHVHLIHRKYYEHGICHQVQLVCPIIELSEVQPRTRYGPGVLRDDDYRDTHGEHVEEDALEVAWLAMKALVGDHHDVEGVEGGEAGTQEDPEAVPAVNPLVQGGELLGGCGREGECTAEDLQEPDEDEHHSQKGVVDEEGTREGQVEQGDPSQREERWLVVLEMEVEVMVQQRLSKGRGT